MHIRIPYIFILIVLFLTTFGFAQGKGDVGLLTISFEEYLGYVKLHHPLLKQANLKLSEIEANLLKSRGGFDPKIEVDYDRKKFKDLEYYDQINATFKIPTWYGIAFKANFEENTGAFLNPNLTVPDGGLYSAGVSFSAAQGFLINERMAMLKKARFFAEQTKAERDLLINNLIFEASKVYLKWVEAHNEQEIYANFLDNAQLRFQGVKRRVIEGDKAAIDSIEAKIILQNRKLNLEAARLKNRKAALNASNFLWIKGVPVEIESTVKPMLPKDNTINNSLLLEGIDAASSLVEHPKLKSIDAKIESLKVDRSLKRNKLLPKLDFEYNFLTPNRDQIRSLNTDNYKAAVNFSIPLLLRKERGDVKLTN